MKRLVTIILGLMLSSCSVGYYAGSNVGVITTANLSLQPAWGPAGYDCAHYYYFPDFNFYYDVNNALFYYLSGTRWVSARQLPYALGYPRDLYKFYKVVLNVRNPWNHNRVHRKEYKHFCGVHTQPVLHNKRPQAGPAQMQRPQNKPTNNGYRPQYNGNRQPQGQQPQKPQNGNVQRPQNNGNAPSYSDRNTIRNSRNNNTSQNNVAPQSTPSRNNGNNASAQKPQSSKPKQNPQTTSGSRGANGSRSNVKPSQPKQSQSSGTTRSSSSKSSSSSGSRSTGSRGR